jgi:methyl-accepting chemotaxis protein
MIQELSIGRLGTRLHIANGEVGQMDQAFGPLPMPCNKVINILNRIAAGDVSADLELLDEQDEITPALIQTTAAIRALVADANVLVEAAVAGQLDTRADASRHQGDSQKIVPASISPSMP